MTPSIAGGSATVSIRVGDATAQALPTFHAAAIALDTPSDIDSVDPSASAHLTPHTQRVPVELSQLSTRRLSREVIDSVLQGGAVPLENDATAQGVAPAAAGTLVSSYTPAQIRAAYDLPPLPALGATLTSAQAAAEGAGQTIYVIDAGDDANAAAELAAFNTKFGLPQCGTANVLAPSTALPIAAASTTAGCAFRQVYASPTGTITSTEPPYSSDWNIEIALDIEYAHATAPLARIVLIEAADSSITSLAAAVSLANAMGPGVVSMSFGGAEAQGWTAELDSNFSAPNMTYLAAAGDSGYQVNWPSVSSHVIAVGGTSLQYNGVNPRTEVLWYLTGGGVSLYTTLPSYQNTSVFGLVPAAGRIVSDVAFNSDPNTGEEIVYYPSKTSTGGNWLAIGGTSLATPQWAGLIAVADAERAAKTEPPLGDGHAAIYALAQSSSVFKGDVFDITSGQRGSCVECVTGVGYDGPSGLGTPNVTNMLATLVGNPSGSAPVVTGASVNGTTGLALTFQVSVTDKDALTLSLINAPPGMTISNTGLVNWASPLQGNYTFLVQALDVTNGHYGQATYTLAVVGAQHPVVTAASATGSAGTVFSFQMATTADTNPLTFTVSGAPSGLIISTAGQVVWKDPVGGIYPVMVTATDGKTGLSGSGSLTITVSAAVAPTVAAQSVVKPAGKPLSVTIMGNYTSNHTITSWISGAPTGMTVNSGSGVISWANPVIGNYSITATFTDTNTGLSGSAVISLSVVAPGPILSAAPITGVAGKALAGTLGVTDLSATSVALSLSGFPMGMTFTATRSGLAVAWANPVVGTYNLGVKAVDTNGYSATATVPVTITAR